MKTYSYNFNGVDYLLFPQEIITIFDQDNNDLLLFLIKNIVVTPKPTFLWNPYFIPKDSIWTKLTPPKGIISYLLINNENKYYCDEGAGTISYDSSGFGQHADINIYEPCMSKIEKEEKEREFHKIKNFSLTIN
jgi:hypothetical protein